ncbi:MAG: hypothetical protein II820_11430 [Ruminiclostridium sp.]|nr:hypothetical protein [Ruminiclostridium sp.]
MKGVFIITIEESVKKDPAKFRAVLESKDDDIREALKDLSAKLDNIIGGAMKEYCESEGAEVEIHAVPSYKTTNKTITDHLDKLIGEHIKDKRKNL